MDKLKSIVVGTDFSEGSRAALAQAARIAERNGARLHVVHVIASLVIEEVAGLMKRDAPELRRQVVEDARTHLTDFIAQLGLKVEPSLEVAVGSTVDELIRLLNEDQADLLVMGVHGMSGRGPGAGTVATQCVRNAPARVLLVKNEQTGPFQRVVAAVDFSDASRLVVEQAIRIARQDKSELTLLNVYQGPWHTLHYRAPTLQASPDFQKQYLDALRGRLENTLSPFRDDLQGLTPRTEFFEYTSHGLGIVEYAHQNQADLVVLGTKGRTNLRYLLMGSTAERVMRELDCSVLAVKPE